MKYFRIIFAAVLTAVLCLQEQPAFAEAEYSDGVYTIIKTEYNNVLITDCNLTDEKIEVPEFVLGYPIAGIGDYAFFSNSYVKEVTLPSAVISIGEYSFANNSGLESVTIPRWCDNIADNAFWNSPNVTIRCWYNSKAFAYATEKGIACELLDKTTLGDADGDGIISISDATTVQRHLAELELLDGIYLLAADVNQDGVSDISDATTLQMYLADYPLQYPIGEGLRISNCLNLKQT